MKKQSKITKITWWRLPCLTEGIPVREIPVMKLKGNNGGAKRKVNRGLKNLKNPLSLSLSLSVSLTHPPTRRHSNFTLEPSSIHH